MTEYAKAYRAVANATEDMPAPRAARDAVYQVMAMAVTEDGDTGGV